MANGRRREEWDHSLLASIAMGAKGINLDQNNPYRRSVERSLTPAEVKEAKKGKWSDYLAAVKAENEKRKNKSGNRGSEQR
jgi:hypothetical protein